MLAIGMSLVGACSSDNEGGGSGGGTSTEPLCDGSSAIRLELSSSGGFVPDYFDDTNPYGYWFVFVDGHCDYWVSPDMRGVRSGHLSDEQAAALAKDVAWDRLQQLEGPDQSCPDAGATVIRSPTHEASCSCGCDTPEKEAVFAKLDGIVKGLWESGTQTDLPLTAFRSPYPPSQTQDSASWPLSWPITDIVELGSSPGTPIPSASDRAALRSLREEYAATHSYFEIISVQVGTTYHGLALRDDLPPSVAAAVDELHAAP